MQQMIYSAAHKYPSLVPVIYSNRRDLSDFNARYFVIQPNEKRPIHNDSFIPYQAAGLMLYISHSF